VYSVLFFYLLVDYNGTYKDQLDSISTEESGVTTKKSIDYDTNDLPTNFLGNTLG
jgi:hypothetical protein